MHYAAMVDSVEIAKELLTKSPDLSLTDEGGSTAKDVAEGETKKLLKSA